MPTFTYTARGANGELKSATIDAPSRDDAVSQLRRQRLTIIKVDEARSTPKKTSGSIAMRDIVIFTRQFSTMINAGLPLVQALDILARQSENKVLASVVREVVFDVESGNTVADAMRKHPKAFSDLYTNMVRKVKGAMIYPVVILCVAGICVIVLLWKVIPVFSSMFDSVGMELPLPTKVVIALSAFLTSFWWALLLGGGAATFFTKRFYATPVGQFMIDKALLTVPVLGDVLRKSAVSRFTRTLGTLISSGVSILDGLEITARTSGNRVVHDAIMGSRASIAGGDTIAGPLQKSEVFPPMVISMIAVGEQTGGLDEMLSKIADFYDDEVDASVGALLSLLEPVMIVFLGVVVGGMIVAMYLPIFDMVNAVK
jgi:type IV pilus assembly protein PilC